MYGFSNTIFVHGRNENGLSLLFDIFKLMKLEIAKISDICDNNNNKPQPHSNLTASATNDNANANITRAVVITS